MESYKIGTFHITGNVILLGDYPEEECIAYLSHFVNVSFNFDKDVQSIGFELQVPNKNRLANIYLFDCSSDEFITMSNAGQRVKPMGVFQLKLSHDGRTDIWKLF